MTLEGAINLNEANDYIVYTMNSVTTGQYAVVIPKNIIGTLNMLVDLHMKSSFDCVVNGSKTKDELVSEITEEYIKLKSKYTDGMLVMPMIDGARYKSIVNNGDKQKMFDEVKKIGAITSELYKKLTEQGVEKQKIDQKIIILEKSVEDELFVNWLKEQSNMASFVDGFKINELNIVQDVINPFISNDSLFGPQVAPIQQEVVAPNVVQSTTATVNNGDVLGNSVKPVTPAAQVAEPVVSGTSVVQEATPVMPVANSDLVSESVVNPVSSSSVDLFGNPSSVQNASVVSTPAQSVSMQPGLAPVVEQQSVVEGPKPVDAAMLEGTSAFTPIPNNSNNQVEGIDADVRNSGDGSSNNNKGFANLLIIVAILIGVTVASIELGKYLFSVYGA